jgi:hypothetical protein
MSMPGWMKWHFYSGRTLPYWKSWPHAGAMLINSMIGEWPAERDWAIVSRKCPIQRKSNRTLTELQTIDKTCLVLLLARRFIGGVYFVAMNCLYFLCLLLAGGVNIVVISVMIFDLILLIWSNLFQIESSILTILNLFCWCLIYFKLSRAYSPYCWHSLIEGLLNRKLWP